MGCCGSRREPFLGPFVGHVEGRKVTVWGRFPGVKQTPQLEWSGLVAERDYNQEVVNLDDSVVVWYLLASKYPGSSQQNITLRSERWAESCSFKILMPLTPGVDEKMPADVEECKVVRFNAGSCRAPEGFPWTNGGDAIFGRMLEEKYKADFTLFMGDQIYADLDPCSELCCQCNIRCCCPCLRSKVRERGEEWFFKKYAQAFGYPNIQTVLRSTPTYHILDDHEARNDFDQDTDIWPAAWPGYRAYQYSHCPSGRNPPQNAKDLYYAFNPAPHVRVFVVDVRTRKVADGAMMDDSQFNILLAWLKKSTPDQVNVIVSSMAVFPDIRRETWRDDPKRRALLLDCAVEENKKLLFLSGDLHRSLYATLETTAPDGRVVKVHQLISSPLAWSGASHCVLSAKYKYIDRCCDKQDKVNLEDSKFKWKTQRSEQTTADSFVHVSIDQAGVVKSQCVTNEDGVYWDIEMTF